MGLAALLTWVILAAPSLDAGLSGGGGEDRLDEALFEVARAKNREGIEAFRRDDLPVALAAFRQAYDITPRDSEITNNLAYLHQRLGNREEAERFYRETLILSPRRGIAHLNLADLLSGPSASFSDLTEAAAALVRARELKGNQPKIILRQARVAARRGRFKRAEAFYHAYLDQRPAKDHLRLELGDFYRGFDELDQALIWYGRVGGEVKAEAAARIKALEVAREARRYGWTRGGVAPKAAQELLTKALALRQAGARAEARDLALRALRLAPQLTDAHALLARLYAAEGDAAAAELSYLRAIVLGSADVALFSDFATWLDEAQRPAEAAFFLKRALQLAPDRVDLRARLARAWQRVGDLPRALEHVNRALAELPEDAPSDELLALQHTLEAALPDGPRRPISAPKDASAQGRLDAARAWLEAGAPEKAMAELRGVDLGAEGAEARRLEVEVRRLEGRVLSAVGREAEALAAFERNPRDATSRLLAGRLRLKRGELSEAEARFEEAQVMGEPRAAVELARLDARYPPDAWPIWSDLWRLGALERAASRLQPFLARADAAGEEARRFSKVLRQRRRLAYSGLIGLGLAFLGLAAALWSASQLRRAVDLATLITAHPEAGPDIQRVLSAIRHEVLKHHALALTGLIEALEAGRPEAAAQAAWCRRSLLGDPAQPDSGAAARLEAYAEALMKIGQAHGARLDLKRKDPALSALLSGFRRLHAARRRLAQAHRLSPGGRRRLTRQLRGAAEALNVRGYEAVQALLDQLRVLRIDAPLLRAIFAQTIQEPAFATQPIAPLALDLEAPCALIISREAFSEILQNLLRNALEASAAAGLRPLEVGLRVRVEIDDITGLAEASFAALDKVEGALDIDALRARPIESGLGLVTRRVTRYEGRLDLWPTSPPWAKAVGVALPLHEGALPPVRTNPLGSRSQGVVRASKEGSSWS